MGSRSLNVQNCGDVQRISISAGATTSAAVASPVHGHPAGMDQSSCGDTVTCFGPGGANALCGYAGERDGAAFGLFEHRAEAELSFDHGSAVSVNITDGRADLGV